MNPRKTPGMPLATLLIFFAILTSLFMPAPVFAAEPSPDEPNAVRAYIPAGGIFSEKISGSDYTYALVVVETTGRAESVGLSLKLPRSKKYNPLPSETLAGAYVYSETTNRGTAAYFLEILSPGAAYSVKPTATFSNAADPSAPQTLTGDSLPVTAPVPGATILSSENAYQPLCGHLAWSFTAAGFDVVRLPEEGSSENIHTTLSDRGWQLHGGIDKTDTTPIPAEDVQRKTYTFPSGLQLWMQPSVYDENFLQMNFIFRNNGTTTITDTNFGITSGIRIAGNAGAKVEAYPSAGNRQGFLMTDTGLENSTGLSLLAACKNNVFEDTNQNAANFWYGAWTENNAEAIAHLYDTSDTTVPYDGAAAGTDSAAAMHWNLNLSPGQLQVCSVIFGVGKAEELKLPQPPAPRPEPSPQPPAPWPEPVPQPPTPTPAPPSITWLRVGGINRYVTAVEAAKIAFPDGSKSVVLVTGEDYPDCLAANAYAGLTNQPILLTEHGKLNTFTSGLLSLWGTTDVTIIGGHASVSQTVEQHLFERHAISADHITRISGADRYETAEAVAKAGSFDTGGACVVVTGVKPCDGLSVSPWCYHHKMPVFFADETGHLRAESLAAANAFRTVYIIGREKSVSAHAEAYFASAGREEEGIVRLGGGNRYETAALVAKHFAEDDHGTSFASGQEAHFPDALIGGMLSGRRASPVLLVDETEGPCFDFLKNEILPSAEGSYTFYLLGDENAVSLETAAALKNINAA